MKKKNGFTLAEVLITLAIIGVVATLTLPALMSNTQEQQAITAFRKSMNTISEIGTLSAAADGIDFTSAEKVGTANDSIKNGELTIFGIFNDRASVDRTLSGVGFKTTSSGQNRCSGTNNIVLRDGTAICMPNAYSPDKQFEVYVDTNGPKAPNMVSICDREHCTDKAGKKLHDQYVVTLWNSTVVPGKWEPGSTTNDTDQESYASRFAMGIAQKSGSGS